MVLGLVELAKRLPEPGQVAIGLSAFGEMPQLGEALGFAAGLVARELVEVELGQGQASLGGFVHATDLAGHGHGLAEAGGGLRPRAQLQSPFPAQRVNIADCFAVVVLLGEGGGDAEVLLLQVALPELRFREPKLRIALPINAPPPLPPHGIEQTPRLRRRRPLAEFGLDGKPVQQVPEYIIILLVLNHRLHIVMDINQPRDFSVSPMIG